MLVVHEPACISLPLLSGYDTASISTSCAAQRQDAALHFKELLGHQSCLMMPARAAAAPAQGFLMVFILFLCCAAAHDQLIKYNLTAFQALYFLSSFFGAQHFPPRLPACSWLPQPCGIAAYNCMHFKP